MKVKWVFLFGVSAIFALMLSVTAAAAQDDEDVLATEFDTMPDAIYLVYGDGERVTSQLVMDGDDSLLRVLTSEPIYLGFYEDEDWEDFSLEVTLRMNRGALFLSGRHALQGCEGYDIYASAAGHLVMLNRSGESCEYDESLATGIVPTFEPNQWATLRMDFIGDDISVWMDDELLFTVADDHYDSGLPYLTYVLEGEETWAALLDISSLTLRRLDGVERGNLADDAG